MAHDLDELEENLLSRDSDGVVRIGGIAAVCTCGWVSQYQDNEDQAIAEHEKHQDAA